jgi:hypothetical protein
MNHNEDMREDSYMVDGVEAFDGDSASNHHPVSVQAEFQANPAMLAMVKKLPLGELDVVGNCLSSSSATYIETTRSPYGNRNTGQNLPRNDSEQTLSSQNSSLSIMRDQSSESFPLRPVPPVEIEQEIDAQPSSTSTWSFACQSARRIEREHEGSISDSGSSFGSLCGWGVTLGENVDNEQQSGESQWGEFQDAAFHSNISSSGGGPAQTNDAEFNMLPDWSDVEGDPEYNVAYVRDCDVCSVTDTSSLDAAHIRHTLVMPEVYVPTGYAGVAGISDAEFDALPEWSDVEDDADHNMPFVRNSDVWSITSISSSDAAHIKDTVVKPQVYIPTGYAGAVVAGPRIAPGDSDKKKRTQDDEGEESMLCKRQKLEGKMQRSSC